MKYKFEYFYVQTPSNFYELTHAKSTVSNTPHKTIRHRTSIKLQSKGLGKKLLYFVTFKSNQKKKLVTLYDLNTIRIHYMKHVISLSEFNRNSPNIIFRILSYDDRSANKNCKCSTSLSDSLIFFSEITVRQNYRFALDSQCNWASGNISQHRRN